MTRRPWRDKLRALFADREPRVLEFRRPEPRCVDCGEPPLAGSGRLRRGRCGKCAQRDGGWPPAA